MRYITRAFPSIAMAVKSDDMIQNHIAVQCCSTRALDDVLSISAYRTFFLDRKMKLACKDHVDEHNH